MPTPVEAIDSLRVTVWTCRNIRDGVGFHGETKDALADNIEAVCTDHERLVSENAKLRLALQHCADLAGCHCSTGQGGDMAHILGWAKEALKAG